MASAVKSKLRGLTGGGSNDDHWKAETEKYRLYVTAGPSYDKAEHKQVPVNTATAVVVENEFLKAKIKVRIRQYRGLPVDSPSHSPYFDDALHEKDQYSIAFSFVPKQDLPSQNTVWGNDFDHPIRERLPPGFNTAFKIVKEFIDPGLACDAYADEPWLYGPSLSSWFAFVIGDKVDLERGEDFPAPDDNDVMKDGAEGEGVTVRQKHHIPDTGDKRRKHFLSSANRDAFTFEKGRLYQGDFYNPYIDFGNFALKLPGFSLKVIKYVDQKSHCLRYVFKNKETGDVYFNVNLHLFWGKELEEALKEDRAHSEQGQQASADAGQGQVQVGVTGPRVGLNGHAPAPRHHGQVQPERENRLPYPAEQQQAQPGAAAEIDSAAPPTMQLHPGNHHALAEETTANKGAAGGNNGAIMSEITKMLQKTSTSDQSGGGKLNIWQR